MNSGEPAPTGRAPHIWKWGALAIAMTTLVACDGKPISTPSSQIAEADTALRMLEAGDGRACAAPATKQTVLQIAHQTFRPYQWSEDEKRAYLGAVSLEAVDITVADKEPSTPWMECEATLRASEGAQSWEQRIGYRLAKQLDDGTLRIELHDARSTSALLARTSESYFRDVITPARRQNADAAAAPICANFRKDRQALSFQEIWDLKGELHHAAERQHLIGLGPLGSACLNEMEEELREARHRVESSTTVASFREDQLNGGQPSAPSSPAKADRIATPIPPRPDGQ